MNFYSFDRCAARRLVLLGLRHSDCLRSLYAKVVLDSTLDEGNLTFEWTSIETTNQLEAAKEKQPIGFLRVSLNFALCLQRWVAT